MDNYNKVKEFHNKFNVFISETPSLPNDNIRNLRKLLLSEEFKEYIDSEKENDIIKISDSLADMLYVIYGTALSYGIPIQEVFNEVHNSNMSKEGKTKEGKLIKGKNYFKPDIHKILYRCGK